VRRLSGTAPDAMAEEMVLKHKSNPPAAARRDAVVLATVRGAVAIVAWLGLAAPSWASLGGSSASIEVDRAHLAARSSTVVNAAYSVHIITLPNGGSVKEFERSDGVVFGIAWHGPSRPDLRQLLGSHFATMQSDVIVRSGRRLRAPLSDVKSDFVVHSAGHPGAFVGAAFLPQQAPASFSVNALQ
jgi:hypothetical protein